MCAVLFVEVVGELEVGMGLKSVGEPGIIWKLEMLK